MLYLYEKLLTGDRTYSFIGHLLLRRFLTTHAIDSASGSNSIHLHAIPYGVELVKSKGLICDGLFASHLKTLDNSVDCPRRAKSVRKRARSFIYATFHGRAHLRCSPLLPKSTRPSFTSWRGIVREMHCASRPSRPVRTSTVTVTPASQCSTGCRRLSVRVKPSSQASGPQPHNPKNPKTRGSTKTNPSDPQSHSPKTYNKAKKPPPREPQIIVRSHDWFGPTSRVPQPEPKGPQISGVPDDVEPGPWVELPPKEEFDDRVSFGVLQPGQSRPIKRNPSPPPLASENSQKDRFSGDEPSFGLKRPGGSNTRADPVPPQPIYHHPEKQSYPGWFGAPKQPRDTGRPRNIQQSERLFGLKQRREPPAHLVPQLDSDPEYPAHSSPQTDETYNNLHNVDSSITSNQCSDNPPHSNPSPNSLRANPAHLNARSAKPSNLRNAVDGSVRSPPNRGSSWSPRLRHQYELPAHLSQQANEPHSDCDSVESSLNWKGHKELPSLPREPHGRPEPDSDRLADKARWEDSHHDYWFGKPNKNVEPHSAKPRGSRWLSDGAFGLKQEHGQQRAHPTEPNPPISERGENTDKQESRFGPIKHPKTNDQTTSQVAGELLRFIRSRTRNSGSESGGTAIPRETTTTGQAWERASLKHSYRFDSSSKPARELDASTQDPITVLDEEASVQQHDPFLGQPLFHESPKNFQPRSPSFRSLRPYTESKGLPAPLRLSSQVSPEPVPRRRPVSPPTRPRSVTIRRPSFFSDTLRQSRGAISDQVANQKQSLRQTPALLAAHRLRLLRNQVSAATDKDKTAPVLSPTFVKWPNGPGQANDT